MKDKVKEWLKRYLPAEVLSMIITLLSTWLTNDLTNNAVTTALVGTLAGNISYFGYILVSDVLINVKICKSLNHKYSWKHFLVNIKALLIEFGLAEIVDSLLVRPTLMYYFPIWVGNLSVGVILAKISADVIFYIPAIIGYELVNKSLKK